jgi:hypothetical protein
MLSKFTIIPLIVLLLLPSIAVYRIEATAYEYYRSTPV